MPTITLNLGGIGGGGVIHGDMNITVDEARFSAIDVAASQTNKQFDLQCDKDTLKAVAMKAEGGAVTIKTNSTSSPDDTIALSAGEVRIWKSGVGTNPFGTADISKLYLTTGSDSTQLQLILGNDF